MQTDTEKAVLRLCNMITGLNPACLSIGAGMMATLRDSAEKLTSDIAKESRKFTVVVQMPTEVAEASGIFYAVKHVEDDAEDAFSAKQTALDEVHADFVANENVGPDMVQEHSPFFVDAIFSGHHKDLNGSGE